MQDPRALLRDNVRLLGGLLGDTIRAHLGEDMFSHVEAIRAAAKEGRNQGSDENQALLEALSVLSDEELVPVARAFNQFLNLANIAEQYHRIRRRGVTDKPEIGERHASLSHTFAAMMDRGVTGHALAEATRALEIELVLTAHPTEVARRTQIQKYDAIAMTLAAMDHDDLLPAERASLVEHLRRSVAGAWHTNDIRTERPTPVDEAKWGFAVIENSLWQAVPDFLRQLDQTLLAATGETLGYDCIPVRFASWMGGDRDGNPNVTSTVTAEVLRISRWMAMDLYVRDLAVLIPELSMHEATPELLALSGGAKEPYRVVLRELRLRVKATRAALDAGQDVTAGSDQIFCREDLLQPLLCCYRSLHACGLGLIADGSLLDTLRRVGCFGVSLVRLDIRQEAGRHTEVLDEACQALGLGSYAAWDEAARQEFLLRELGQVRPLLPRDFTPGESAAEVLAACRVIASRSAEVLGSYVISMAGQPSDVLAVILLLRECGIQHNMQVVPLFETLQDLENASGCMQRLLDIEWYRNYIDGRQEVMIGYSDSAKGAGKLSATWAQYQAQEALVGVCAQHDVRLTLFHGRGGTVGRGGGPAQAAIFSQPPGSVNGSLRVTEQGEVIRHKFGMPAIACQSMAVYVSAVLEASMLPPPVPEPAWRALMDRLSATAFLEYTNTIEKNADFVPYFRQLTPEQELARLPLGSRPAKRRAEGGVETLRAIPWVFAWTQTRLMLPAWLGCGVALQKEMAGEHAQELGEMVTGWPFFRSFLDMLEMVLAKSDGQITGFYEQRLVDPNLRDLGAQLRERLLATRAVVMELLGRQELLEDNPDLRQSIDVRNPYLDPLHYLQAELLVRERRKDQAENPATDRALMITMAGIAAGLRNTG